MTIREHGGEEIASHLIDAGEEAGKALMGFEGFMLPSNLEIKLAKASGFDLYTITYLTFVDMAYRLNFNPNLHVIAKKNLADCDEKP